MTAKTEIFAAYGDDAPAALLAWSNVDPATFHAWHDSCAERQYVADFRRWESRHLVKVSTPVAPSVPALFETAPAPSRKVEIRASVVHDGTSMDTLSLAGFEGAQILREAAIRDLGPAETTAARCHSYIDIAGRMEAATLEAGRPVSVAEVMERAA